MKKKNLVIIGAVLILIIVGTILYFNSYEEFTPDFTSALPHDIVYKTKGDYYNLIPVVLSEDKLKIMSMPDMTDIYDNGELVYNKPEKLIKGYLLGGGVYKNSAFLSITYEDVEAYSGFLEKTPSSIETYEFILEKEPFLELYDCGVRVEDNKVEFYNSVINSGQLIKCNRII